MTIVEDFEPRARSEGIVRIVSHLKCRRSQFANCVNFAISEAANLHESLAIEAAPFVDGPAIIDAAKQAATRQMDDWGGLQLSQCKADTVISDWATYSKKAKNHQDQTSWKVSGDHFFAPYISKARRFLRAHSERLRVSTAQRARVFDFLCLSLALSLLRGEVKFKRTKKKPLIRHRTLVRSNGIHAALEALHRALRVGTFIERARQRRKQSDGKSNIIAADFFRAMRQFTERLFLQQRRRVLAVLNHGEAADDGDGDAHIVFGALDPPQSLSMPNVRVEEDLKVRDVPNERNVDAYELQRENDMLRQQIERINERRNQFQERLSTPAPLIIPPPVQELSYPCASYAHAPYVACAACFPSLNPSTSTSLPPIVSVPVPAQYGEQMMFQGGPIMANIPIPFGRPFSFPSAASAPAATMPISAPSPLFPRMSHPYLAFSTNQY